MASGRPARAADHVLAVIDPAVHDLRAAGLLLEMALIAQAHVAGFEHFIVHGTVRRMTHGTALTHHLVLEDEWSSLRGMTFCARGVDGGGESLRPAGHRIRVTLVWIMAIGARDFPLEDGMCVRQAEFRAVVGVTLHARVGRDFRIYDGRASAGFDVQARRAVA